MVRYININFSEDPSYRYKMPAIELRSQGRGNGIQFVVENMRDVAVALCRSPEQLTKYFQTSLGNYGKFNTSDGSSVFTGNANIAQANQTLRSFIFGYVLCPDCGNPETRFELRDASLISTCAACGKASTIKSTDKFTKYLYRELETALPARSRKASALRKPAQAFARFRKTILADVPAADRAATLSGYVEECIDAHMLIEEERVFFYFAATFDNVAPTQDTIRAVIPVWRILVQSEEKTFVLYALECLCRRYESELFNRTTNLLSFLLQQLYTEGIVDDDAVRMWSTELADPVVPYDYHERVLQSAQPFLDWFEANDDDEEYEEDD